MSLFSNAIGNYQSQLGTNIGGLLNGSTYIPGMSSPGGPSMGGPNIGGASGGGVFGSLGQNGSTLSGLNTLSQSLGGGGLLSGPTGNAALWMDNTNGQAGEPFKGFAVKANWKDQNEIFKAMGKDLISFGFSFGKVPSASSQEYKNAQVFYFANLQKWINLVKAGKATVPQTVMNDPYNKWLLDLIGNIAVPFTGVDTGFIGLPPANTIDPTTGESKPNYVIYGVYLVCAYFLLKFLKILK